MPKLIVVQQYQLGMFAVIIYRVRTNETRYMAIATDGTETFSIHPTEDRGDAKQMIGEMIVKHYSNELDAIALRYC